MRKRPGVSLEASRKGQRQPEAVRMQAEGSQWQARSSQEAARRDWETLETHKGDHLEHPVTLLRAWGASNIQENVSKN
jgi:hypothetical protein